MKWTCILSTAAILFAGTAVAQEGKGAATGMVGGAATGAIVGGPVGAGIGAVVGGVAGGAIDPPPREVVTYVEEAPMPAQPIVVEQEIVVGKPVPETVVLTPVPQNPDYAYTVVNERRIIVEPKSRTVVQVLD
ncbi:DUF1236 domain-containing protein [Rhizobium sp. LC145]|uniref:DUF1236 domain-containing protein n=1 Tax=Rhizobium sp. LC145 TaxID=1120688 RepID=UPI000629FAC0|nr:DUF1236 domain-containing protein [Rhizobium sp. LC145]KKX33629.1 membrane protein [Rhizobium sp. LC145]